VTLLLRGSQNVVQVLGAEDSSKQDVASEIDLVGSKLPVDPGLKECLRSLAWNRGKNLENKTRKARRPRGAH
jgi:hypothetical protein